jgi:hypothetical protein
MAYSPTTWEDEVPDSTPVKYTITDDTAGEIAASATIDLATAPTTSGTPINAANLNHIEQGIADVEAATVPDILTAKGDLVSASAADTAEILNVGAAGTYLIPDSSEASGLKWAAMITHGLYTSTSWDGDAITKDTTYTINAASVFSTPAAAKMLLINIGAQWASLNLGAEHIFICNPAAAVIQKGFIVLTPKYQAVDDFAAGWVPLDSSGQFAVRSTGTYSPTHVYINIIAYML